MLHKVKALDTYTKMNVMDSEQKDVLKEGFVFEVDDERLKVLLGDNVYGVAFVEKTDDPVAEKPKRRSRKK